MPFAVDALHGDRSQRDREAALQRFRSGATQAGRDVDANRLGKKKDQINVGGVQEKGH